MPIINIDETAFKTSVSDLNSRLSNILNDEDMIRYPFAARRWLQADPATGSGEAARGQE